MANIQNKRISPFTRAIPTSKLFRPTHKSKTIRTNTKISNYGTLRNRNLHSKEISRARCMIQQIKEEISFEAVTSQNFHARVEDLITLVEKIMNNEKGQIALQLLSLYQTTKTPLLHKYSQLYEEGIRSLDCSLRSSSSQFFSLVIEERIDNLILYYLKYFPTKKTSWNQKFPSLCRQLCEKNKKIINFLPKKQRQEYLQNVQHFIATIGSKKCINENRIRRNTIRIVREDTGVSIASYSSSSHSTINERLVRFNEHKRRESFNSKLYQINNKIRGKRNSALKISQKPVEKSRNSKRVSSRWGKNQLISFKESIYNNSIKGSKFIVQKEQTELEIKAIQTQNKIHSEVFENIINVFQETVNECIMKKFYLFVQLRGKIRIFIVDFEKVDVSNYGQLIIKIKGPIYQNLKYKLTQQLATDLFNEDRIRSHLLSCLDIQKVNYWFKFYIRRNLRSSLNSKSQLIIKEQDKNEKYLYSFIKKLNVFYFSKLSFQPSNSDGTITIFSPGFDETYEKKKIHLYKNPQLYFIDEYQDYQNDSDFIPNVKYFPISVEEQMLRQKPAFEGFKILKHYSSGSKNLRRSYYSEKLIFKIDKKYSIISSRLERKNDSYILYNKAYTRSFQHYEKEFIGKDAIYGRLNDKNKSTINSLMVKFKERIIKKKSNGVICNLSLFQRGNNNYSTIKNLVEFVLRVHRFGYLQGKIYVFKENVKNLMFIEIYCPQSQNYYHFPMDSTNLQTLFPHSFTTFTHLQLREWMKSALKCLKVALWNKNQIHLLITVGSSSFKLIGKQIVSRKSFIKDHQLRYLDSYLLDSEAEEGQQIKFHRHIISVNNKLSYKYDSKFNVNLPQFVYDKRTLRLRNKIRQQADKVTYESVKKIFERDENEFYIPEFRCNQIISIKSLETSLVMRRVDILNDKESYEELRIENPFKLKKKSLLRWIKRELKVGLF